MTCTKKIGYMFSLLAKEHSNDGWSFVVKHGCHDHDFPTYAEGQPLGKLLKDEYEEAFMRAVKDVFPESAYHLCRRHIEVNVRKHALKFTASKKFSEGYMRRFNEVISAPDAEVCDILGRVSRVALDIVRLEVSRIRTRKILWMSQIVVVIMDAHMESCVVMRLPSLNTLLYSESANVSEFEHLSKANLPRHSCSARLPSDWEITAWYFGISTTPPSSGSNKSRCSFIASTQSSLMSYGSNSVHPAPCPPPIKSSQNHSPSSPSTPTSLPLEGYVIVVEGVVVDEGEVEEEAEGYLIYIFRHIAPI
ncbi:hypothetical protein LIER_34560 [Lithospermum erythrorhizon]|uniref:MULE transposase domain-containing protein n=1 Tax=Lithospermum erythrorhizon TaxID=34254 RepID=A0AAV3S3D1_LITER